MRAEARTADRMSRAENAEFVRLIIESWLADMTRGDAVALLEEYGVPSGPVYTAPDLNDNPHLGIRKMLVSSDEPIAGPRR